MPSDNLLGEIRLAKGNIFFIPPAYIDSRICDPIPPYEITSCNETGLWLEYDESIEKACESLLDPFNATYKNYFCYLCNVDFEMPQNMWVCPPLENVWHTQEPEFSFMIDPALAVEDSIPDSLFCEDSQFPDKNLVSGSYIYRWASSRENLS